MAGMVKRMMDTPMEMDMPSKVNVIKRKGSMYVPVRKMPNRSGRMGSGGLYV